MKPWLSYKPSKFGWKLGLESTFPGFLSLFYRHILEMGRELGMPKGASPFLNATQPFIRAIPRENGAIFIFSFSPSCWHRSQIRLVCHRFIRSDVCRDTVHRFWICSLFCNLCGKAQNPSSGFDILRSIMNVPEAIEICSFCYCLSYNSLLHFST